MNPRDPFESNGFQDRRFQPLTHSSVSKYNLQRLLAAHRVTILSRLLHDLSSSKVRRSIMGSLAKRNRGVRLGVTPAVTTSKPEF